MEAKNMENYAKSPTITVINKIGAKQLVDDRNEILCS